MAKFLIDNLEKITYQIDIEIGLLARKNRNSSCHFINLKTDSIIQTDKFKTDIQYYTINNNELGELLQLPQELANIIFEYIPNCFKENYR